MTAKSLFRIREPPSFYRARAAAKPLFRNGELYLQFAHAGLKAHALRRHALSGNLGEQMPDHEGTLLRRCQIQRGQALVDDADSAGETQLGRSHASARGGLQHEGADGDVRKQEAIDFLHDAFGRATAQSAGRQAQMGFDFVEDQLDMPALMEEHSQLLGWVELRIQQGGHEPMGLTRAGHTLVSEGVTDDAHQPALATLMVLILIDVGQVAAIGQALDGFSEHVAFEAAQHVRLGLAGQEDQFATVEATVPQQEHVWTQATRQQFARAADLALAAATDFDIGDQMRATFDQQHQAHLGKGTVRGLIIGTGAKEGAIVLGIRHRVYRPIDGHQPHAFPEGPRGLFRRSWTGTQGKEPIHRRHTQLRPSIAEGRFARHLLGQVREEQAQAGDHLGVDSALRELGIESQGHQPVEHGVHVQALFAVFPGMAATQDQLHQFGPDDLLQQAQVKLVTHLVIKDRFAYGSAHRGVSFLFGPFDGYYAIWNASWLSRLTFFLIELYWGTPPRPSARGFAPCTPLFASCYSLFT